MEKPNMDSTEAVKTAFEGAHMWFDGTTADITAEQANHAQPGACHSIGALMAHIIQCEDVMLSTFVMGGTPSLWDREWAKRLGGPLLVDFPAEPDRMVRYDPEAMREYGKAVFAQTDGYIKALSPAEIDHELDLTAAGMGKMPTATFLLTMLLGNTYAHTGEISALKGLQSLKGYPF
jgi:hypothetical protein